MNRPRDYAYEALAEVTGTDMSAGRGELNAALKSIREQSEIADSYILADEIHTRAKLYRQVMPDVMLTPTALSKHWLRVFEETQARKVTGTNLSVDRECTTCGGDRFVVVAQRKPAQTMWMKEHEITPNEKEMIEEYAPCPDCGPQVRGAPDPAKVREMMRK